MGVSKKLTVVLRKFLFFRNLVSRTVQENETTNLKGGNMNRIKGNLLRLVTGLTLGLGMVLSSNAHAQSCPEGFVVNNLQFDLGGYRDLGKPRCVRIVQISSPTPGYQVGDILIGFTGYPGMSDSQISIQKIYRNGAFVGAEAYSYGNFQFHVGGSDVSEIFSANFDYSLTPFAQPAPRSCNLRFSGQIQMLTAAAPLVDTGGLLMATLSQAATALLDNLS